MVAKCLAKIYFKDSELALKLPFWKLLRREPGSVAGKIRFDGGMCRARTYNRPVMSGELYH